MKRLGLTCASVVVTACLAILMTPSVAAAATGPLGVCDAPINVSDGSLAPQQIVEVSVYTFPSPPYVLNTSITGTGWPWLPTGFIKNGNQVDWYIGNPYSAQNGYSGATKLQYFPIGGSC